MKRLSITLAIGGLVVAAGNFAAAQDEDQAEPAFPVEIYSCSFNEGKGPKDTNAAAAKWNAWADKRGMDDYSAWTLLPFYAGPNQDFDILWLGTASNAKSLGRAQDDWLANGAEVRAEFDSVSPCNAHGNFAAVQFKAPPDRGDAKTAVLSFSDCNMADGKNFSKDVAPALGAWAKYRESHDSKAGMWVLFPAYGGGGEEFDFKLVVSHANLEEQGSDWDQYSEAGWQKAEEIFGDMLDCDAARVYIATNQRRAKDDD
jgi:hypothetical protein